MSELDVERLANSCKEEPYSSLISAAWEEWYGPIRGGHPIQYHKESDRHMLLIKAMGLLPVKIPSEHIIPSLKSITPNSIVKGHKIKLGALEWHKAKELKPKTSYRDGNYLLVPRLVGTCSLDKLDLKTFTMQHGIDTSNRRNVPLIFPLNMDTAWLLGLYVAEGHNASKEAVFSLNENEQDISDRIISIYHSLGYRGGYQTRQVGEHGIQVHLPSRLLSRAFSEWCGHKAPNKKIPQEILLHSNLQLLQAFFHGYLEGDGCIVNNKFTPINQPNTTSRTLAIQLQLLSARLGIGCRIVHVKPHGEGVILGRKVSFHDNYVVTIDMAVPRRPQFKMFNNYIAFPIRKISNMENPREGIA